MVAIRPCPRPTPRRAARARALAALLLLLAAAARLPAPAGTSPEDHSADGAWTLLEADELVARRASPRVRPWIRPSRCVAAEAHHAALDALLAAAPMEFTAAARRGPAVVLALPRPDGRFERFAVVASPVMEPGLEEWFAARGFPMRTFRLRSLDQPATLGRLDWGGPHGLHAVVRSPADGIWYVDPAWQFDDRLHVAYRRADLAPRPDGRAWRCGVEAPRAPPHADALALAAEAGRRSPAALRTFRFAMAATGEYTFFHGATLLDGQAALVTAANRINEVFEADLGIRLVLVANNHLLVSTSAGSDPYTDGDAVTMTTQNRLHLDAVIGAGNYDIGHVVGAAGSGGYTGAIGNACLAGTGGFSSPHKAEGATSTADPVGDAFDIDAVAHQLGHQFAAQHTWNSCYGLGSAHGLAVEPGSGAQIMRHAGGCGEDTLTALSVASFHVASIAEVEAYLATIATCHASVPTANAAAPAINAGADHTIPANTPFELVAASVGDADGDTVTVSWEQDDAGVFGAQASAAASPASATGPVFRSFLPSLSPARSFPSSAELVAGAPYPLGERLPTVARTLTFRAVARDNHPEVGRVAHDAMTLTVAASAGFALTAPNGGGSFLPGATPVTWSVAGTSAPPVGAATVDVHLSTDGGTTFPTLLAAALPNTGSGSVVLPNVVTSAARLRIGGSGNVFYDISDGDFAIAGSLPAFEAAGAPTISDGAAGFANGNGIIEPDEEQVALTISVRNAGVAAASGVTATLASLTPTVAVAAAGPRAYPDLAAGGGEGANAAPFLIDVAPGHACGAPIDLRLTVASAEGSNHFDLTLPTGLTTPAILLPEEGFEAALLPAGWATTTAAGTNRWAVRADAASAGTPAAGASLASHEPPASGVTDTRLVTPAVSGATQLAFHHAYNVEQRNASVAYDGLVLEVSTDDGATWLPLDDEITTGGYTRTADGGAGSPLAVGRGCWAGTSAGFPAMAPVVVDLSAWSADSLRVAFRYTEDNCCSGSNAGWFLDRVVITGTAWSCDAVPVELSAFALD